MKIVSSYEKKENEWTASVADFPPNLAVLNYIFPLKTEYEKYTYDEEENAYVYSFHEEEDTWEGKNETNSFYKLKFKDGKLIFIELNDEDKWTLGSTDSTIKMTFTYGGQTVTLPEGLPEISD